MHIIGRWSIPVVAFLAVAAVAWAETGVVAPSEACPEISRAVDGLAKAEHQQAFALDLYSKSDAGPGPHRGALPAVEARLAEMLARIDDLRTTLRRVRAAPGAPGNPAVRECIEVGESALRQGERVSSEVERVVVDARGYPPAGTASAPVKSGAPEGRSSPTPASAPVPPGAVAR
jgi:hypothetical protein